ncbi:hypothetical protein [Nocardioides zeae]
MTAPLPLDTTTGAGPRVRDLGIDAARGLALVSMFVAHFAPTAGPGGVLDLSEYLTAPLFAFLIGWGPSSVAAARARWSRCWCGRRRSSGSACSSSAPTRRSWSCSSGWAR